MRKETTITLEDRGKQLTFKVREMSATALEGWIMRAILCLSSAGEDIPAEGGIEGIGAYIKTHGLGALAKLDYEKAKPLLDELLGCCSRVMDKAEEKVTPENADAYIEDVTTLFKLRMEALKMNLSFFSSVVPSITPNGAKESKAKSSPKISVN